MKFYKYQGAGNDFLIADNREGNITEKDGVLTAVLEDGTIWSKSIAELCDRRYGVGADGLMLLDAGTKLRAAGTAPDVDKSERSSEGGPEGTDFHMTYFNSDGSGGMMCGNGGRCIVAFAKDCGVEGIEIEDGMWKYVFTAADGHHEAYVMSEEGTEKIVRLKMKDVDTYQEYETLAGVNLPSQGYFLETGTRHYVRFVEDLGQYDIVAEGRDIRYNAQELQPVGANVNFVEPDNGVLKVRTYEKGVEDETFACGTGIVASALASYVKGIEPQSSDASGRICYDIKAKKDSLSVDFLLSEPGFAKDVFLTGPATFVCTIMV